MKLSVILPTYNEERTIRELLSRVLSVQFPPECGPVEIEVIVVDDGSTDRTAEIVALEPRAKLVRHERNRGKGAAIRTALGHVTGDVVLIQDADLEYSVEDYPRLLQPFLDERSPGGLRLALSAPPPSDGDALDQLAREPHPDGDRERALQREDHRRGDLLQGLPRAADQVAAAAGERLRLLPGGHRAGAEAGRPDPRSARRVPRAKPRRGKEDPVQARV